MLGDSQNSVDEKSIVCKTYGKRDTGISWGKI
jgi:hypothetical protein